MEEYYIGRQRLIVSTVSEHEAVRLQGGLSDGNKRHLVPVLERVLQEMSVPGQHVRIDSLKIELGTLPLEGLWEEGGRRLERVLRRELKEVLRGHSGGDRLGVIAKTESLTRLDAVGFYLMQGYFPNWLNARSGVSFRSLFVEVVELSPGHLQGLIVDLGRHERVLKRLVIQLDEVALCRLVAMLEPEHAAVILGYLSDVRQVHRTRPLVALSEQTFADMAWLVTLGYLIHNPGSQFNRKQYMQSLLGGIAQRQGVEYSDLLGLLEVALEAARGRQSPKSSVPAVIAELVRDYRRVGKRDGRFENCPDVEPIDPDVLNIIRGNSGKVDDWGKPGEPEALAGGQGAPSEPGEPNGFVELFREQNQVRAQEKESRREGADSDWVAFFRSRTPRQVLRGLRWVIKQSGQGMEGPISKMLSLMPSQDWANLLLPEYKRELAGIVQSLSSIGLAGSVKQGSSFTTGRAGVHSRVLWRAVVRYLIEKGDESLDIERLKAALIAVKVDELGSSTKAVAQALKGRDAKHDGVDVSRVAQGELVRGERGNPILADGISRALSLRRFDRLGSLHYFLQYGTLPWMSYQQTPGLSVKDLVLMIPELEVSVLSDVLHLDDKGASESRIRRLLAVLSDHDVEELLLRMLPAKGEGAGSFAQSLRAYKGTVKDGLSLYAKVLSAVLRGALVDLDMLLDQDFDAAKLDRADERRRLNGLDFHVLVSLLMEAIGEGKDAGGGGILSDVLEELVVRYPRQTSALFKAGLVRQDGVVRIVERVTVPVYLSLLACLQSQGLPKLENILALLRELPDRLRPDEDEYIRQMLLLSVLRWRQGDADGMGFYPLLVERLMGGTLSVQTLDGMRDAIEKSTEFKKERQQLMRALDEWPKRNDAAKTGGSRDIGSHGPRGVLGFLDEAAEGWRESLYRFLKSGKVGRDKGDKGDSTLMRQLLGSPGYALQALLDESSEKTRAVVRECMAHEQTRHSWARTLPDPVLARICFVVEPGMHRRVFEAGEVLARAWEDAVSRLNRSLVRRSVFWSFFLDFLNDRRQINRSTESLVGAFFEYFSGHYRKLGGSEASRPDLGRALLAGASGLARKSGHSALSSVLHHNRQMLLELWGNEPVKREARAVAHNQGERDQAAAKNPGQKGEPAFALEGDAVDEESDPIYIENAGLVLTGVFLPHLFKGLDLLHVGDDGRARMKDEASVSRAVHMLQYLVDGRTDAPEPLLVLNKLLCGVPIGFPVEREIRLDEREIEMCDMMHQSMLKNWSALSATSVRGLQETFMQREGRLNKVQDGWKLRVQRKTLDVLVDQVPWGLSMVSNGWMPQPVFVSW